MSTARRSSSASSQSSSSPRGPEHKIGPFPGGISLAIWLNAAETDEGTRKYRSISLSPRRYIDRESGEWRDSSSYFPGDIPALIYALQKAQEYLLTTPIPGEKAEQDAIDRAPF